MFRIPPLTLLVMVLRRCILFLLWGPPDSRGHMLTTTLATVHLILFLILILLLQIIILSLSIIKPIPRQFIHRKVEYF